MGSKTLRCVRFVKQKNRRNDTAKAVFLIDRDPGEIRTLDPMIKSHLLYQLSYGVSIFIGLQINTFFFMS